MLRTALLGSLVLAVAALPANAQVAPVLVSGARADGDAHPVAVSADGRYVAFNSDAENLTDEDWPSDGVHIEPVTGFVRDVRTGTLVLVGRQSTADGGAAADDATVVSDMSPDGRFAVFTSRADNLSRADVDEAPSLNALDHDVFLRDLVTGTTTLVGPRGQHGRVSDDGRFVAFTTIDRLAGSDRDRAIDVYVADVARGTVIHASPRTGNRYGTNDAHGHALSGNGRYVTYTSRPYVRGDEWRYEVTVHRFDLRSRRSVVVHRQQQATPMSRSYETAISADGRSVAFMAIWRYQGRSVFAPPSAARKVGPVGVFVWREKQRRARLISIDRCRRRARRILAGDVDLSGDGRRVAWVTLPVSANELTIDVAVAPVGRCDTRYVAHAAGPHYGATPALSRDGRWIAYASQDPRLGAQDQDGHADVFLQRLPGA